jgi:hypothetical protein
MPVDHALGSTAELAEALGLLLGEADEESTSEYSGGPPCERVLIRRITLPDGRVAFQACWRHEGRLCVEDLPTREAALKARVAKRRPDPGGMRRRAEVRDVEVDALAEADASVVVDLLAGLVNVEAFARVDSNTKRKETSDETEAAA